MQRLLGSFNDRRLSNRIQKANHQWRDKFRPPSTFIPPRTFQAGFVLISNRGISMTTSIFIGETSGAEPALGTRHSRVATIVSPQKLTRSNTLLVRVDPSCQSESLGRRQYRRLDRFTLVLADAAIGPAGQIICHLSAREIAMF